MCSRGRPSRRANRPPGGRLHWTARRAECKRGKGWRRAGELIAHIILFSPRSDLTETARRDLLESLAQAANEIPAVKRFVVGRRMTHGLPGYEQVMQEDYAFAAIVEVEDVEGLKAYLSHPSHRTIGRHFTASAARSLAYDYEIVEARTATDLLT